MNYMLLIRWLQARRIAVLKGGSSSEREISLKTGAAVLQAFKRLGIRAVGIDVQSNLPEVLRKKRIQFCFNALHGTNGEDGRVQGCLDVMGLPYTGEGVFASAVAMDKHLSKTLFKKNGVPTAPWMLVHRLDYLRSKKEVLAAVRRFMTRGPLFIKPNDQGSAIGVSKVERPREIDKALKACFALSSGAMVERFVTGRELTVGILGECVLPVIEIIPQHSFYDFHSKYAKGGSKHIVPAPLSRMMSMRAQVLALKAFQAIPCSVYGRVDLLLQPNGQMKVLEVNTIPGMTTTSLLPDAAKAAGMDFDKLVLEIIRLSLKKKK